MVHPLIAQRERWVHPYQYWIDLEYSLHLTGSSLHNPEGLLPWEEGLRSISSRISTLQEGLKQIVDEHTAITVYTINSELHVGIRTNSDLYQLLTKLWKATFLPEGVKGYKPRPKEAEDVAERVLNEEFGCTLFYKKSELRPESLWNRVMKPGRADGQVMPLRS